MVSFSYFLSSFLYLLFMIFIRFILGLVSSVCVCVCLFVGSVYHWTRVTLNACGTTKDDKILNDAKEYCYV